MASFWVHFREAGVWAFLELFAFVLGLVPALLAVVLGGASLGKPSLRGWARGAGAMALLVASACFVLGGVGTMIGRKQVDRALEGIEGAATTAPIAGAALGEPQFTAARIARIRRQGYLEARGASTFGAGFGAPLALLGAIGFLLAMKRARTDGKPEPTRALGWIGVALAAASIVPLAIAGTRPVPEEVPLGGEDVERPDVAASAKQPDAVGLGGAPDGGEAPIGPQPRVTIRAGTPTVTGRLPPEMIARLLRQGFGRFRVCYEHHAHHGEQGRVAVRFVIDREGRVRSAEDAGSDLPSPEVVRCVVESVGDLTFPAPEGGVVTVVYPLLFSRAERERSDGQGASGDLH